MSCPGYLQRESRLWRGSQVNHGYGGAPGGQRDVRIDKKANGQKRENRHTRFFVHQPSTPLHQHRYNLRKCLVPDTYSGNPGYGGGHKSIMVMEGLQEGREMSELTKKRMDKNVKTVIRAFLCINRRPRCISTGIICANVLSRIPTAGIQVMEGVT